jgi:hypothetical protein
LADALASDDRLPPPRSPDAVVSETMTNATRTPR